MRVEAIARLTLGWWGVNAGESQSIAKEVADGVGVLDVENGVHAEDHGSLLIRR
jgi:hypothetical protein